MSSFSKYRKELRKQLKEEQKGMMVVEAVITFTVFLMVVIAIIYLINVFVIHNKIQFAMNTAAHELASYSYLYQALGIRGAEQQIASDGASYTGPIDDTATQVVDTLNKIQTLSGDISGTAESVKQLEVSQESISNAYNSAKQTYEDGMATVESTKNSVQQVTDLFSDPQSLLVGVIYMGASGASYAVKSVGAQAAASVLTKQHLGSNADEILRAYGVKDGASGLDFSGSTMYCDEDKKMIDFVVQYDIDMSFIRFVVPKDIHVVQRVTVPAWLDGDGRTYNS